MSGLFEGSETRHQQECTRHDDDNNNKQFVHKQSTEHDGREAQRERQPGSLEVTTQRGTNAGAATAQIHYISHHACGDASLGVQSK